MLFLLLLLVFVGVAGLLYGTYLFANRRSLSAKEAALERLQEVEMAVQASRGLLRDDTVSELEPLDKALQGREFTLRVSDQIRRAGWTITVGSFVLRSALAIAVGFVVGRLVGGTFGMIAGTVIGIFIPGMWLRRAIRQRERLFREQLPDALDMLVSAMKAGYSFQAAMKFIGEEVAAPWARSSCASTRSSGSASRSARRSSRCSIACPTWTFACSSPPCSSSARRAAT